MIAGGMFSIHVLSLRERCWEESSENITAIVPTGIKCSKKSPRSPRNLHLFQPLTYASDLIRAVGLSLCVK
ncbi:hypothetical protein RIR_jg32133.t1 [Rhizophagus irregularis DAOM 181602=DAOM 197198]|nr:hypothetical protein RIR_jg32133.t1 [Rhizophagus irregularis DAOM 181602=DAOM 197198]